ncbi:MAG: LacI family DNA-binding transcriptional regulator [Anaerolineae bacterium]|nr:LacI family DNA-binding transcriptional regulator [Anaerolineae bacterium]
MSPVTIRDVATRLNLSITTVSRALDGYADVAAATRARVETAAREMGYAPSHMARQMRRQRTDAIGFVIPVTRKLEGGSRAFADPYFSEFIAGLGDEATRHRLDLLVSVATEEDEQPIYERWARGRRVDGFVLNRMRAHDWRARFLLRNSLPFVANGREIGEVTYPFIEVDSRSGFSQLVAHLAGLGHRRIAYIGGLPNLRSQSDRLSGYRAGLKKAGIAFDKRLVAAGDLTRQGGYLAALELLQRAPRPTALIGMNDMTALGAMRAANELGLQVGRDVAIAGFDGIDDGAHASPPLTTLIQPAYSIARQSVQMLVALINGDPIVERQIVLQPELVARASTLGTS